PPPAPSGVGERGFIRLSINRRSADAGVALGWRGWDKANSKNRDRGQEKYYPARLHLSFADHVSLIDTARAENVQRVNHIFAANHNPAPICIDNARKGPRLRWSERHTIPLKARTNCFCCYAMATACLILGTFAYS